MLRDLRRSKYFGERQRISEEHREQIASVSVRGLLRLAVPPTHPGFDDCYVCMCMRGTLPLAVGGDGCEPVCVALISPLQSYQSYTMDNQGTAVRDRVNVNPSRCCLTLVVGSDFVLSL